MTNEKQPLVEELKGLLEQNVTEVKEQVESLKNQFYRLYHEEQAALKRAAMEAAEAVGEELQEWEPVVDEAEKSFRDLLNQYKQKRAEVAAKEEAERQQNLLRKQNILAQMKEMSEAETADVMGNLQKMRDLQAEWKSIGAVPAQNATELWKQYNLYQEQFYDLVKINIELRDLDFKKNLEMKTLLCEAAEKLKENPNIVEANRALQQLHDEWAEIGPVARELREDLWNRFKEASTVINKKHQAYFDEIHKREAENLELKRAVIEKIKAIDIENIKSNKGWDEATEQLNALQLEWRKIGFAPKKQNQSIYEEYKAACDVFFKAKSAFFKDMRQELSRNLSLKKELIQKVNELKDSTAWQETTDSIIALQKQWKQVGPVARKYSEDLWQQFTTACDEFFNAKREATQSAREAFRQKRQEAKERWNKRLDGMTDKQKLVRMYENLQQEIKTAENNILFFIGKSKSGDKLVQDMQKKIDGLKEQLHDLEKKILGEEEGKVEVAGVEPVETAEPIEQADQTTTATEE